MLARVLMTMVSLYDNGQKTASLGQVSCALLGVCLENKLKQTLVFSNGSSTIIASYQLAVKKKAL